MCSIEGSSLPFWNPTTADFHIGSPHCSLWVKTSINFMVMWQISFHNTLFHLINWALKIVIFNQFSLDFTRFCLFAKWPRGKAGVTEGTTLKFNLVCLPHSRKIQKLKNLLFAKNPRHSNEVKIVAICKKKTKVNLFYRDGDQGLGLNGVSRYRYSLAGRKKKL